LDHDYDSFVSTGSCKEEDQDCVGQFEPQTCNEQCEDRVFVIEEPKKGNGAACLHEAGEVLKCDFGTDACVEPLDCSGHYEPRLCSENCENRVYVVDQQKIGSGSTCPHEDGDVVKCEFGTDACVAPVDCSGHFEPRRCNVNCEDRIYVIDQPKVGTGAECSNQVGDVLKCEFGTDACVAPVDCSGHFEPRTCSERCENRFYVIDQPKIGTGAECPYRNMFRKKCEYEQDECKAPVNCVGGFDTTCNANCDPITYHILEDKVGSGKACDYKDGEKVPCNYGDGLCKKPKCAFNNALGALCEVHARIWDVCGKGGSWWNSFACGEMCQCSKDDGNDKCKKNTLTDQQCESSAKRWNMCNSNNDWWKSRCKKTCCTFKN